jgi:hypothetical protein
MDAAGGSGGPSSLNSAETANRGTEPSPAVRTYGIGDPDAAADEDEEQYDNF